MQHRPWRKTGYQITTLIAAALLLLILFITAGYFFMLQAPAVKPDREPLRLAYDRNLALWESRRPVAFEYVVARDCFCVPDYRRPYLARESGDRRLAVYASPLAPQNDATATEPPGVVWLDDLFALIGEAIGSADAITVIYDPGFGFPTSVSIDWSYEVADEEQRFTVRDFQVIEYRE